MHISQEIEVWVLQEERINDEVIVAATTLQILRVLVANGKLLTSLLHIDYSTVKAGKLWDFNN